MSICTLKLGNQIGRFKCFKEYQKVAPFWKRYWPLKKYGYDPDLDHFDLHPSIQTKEGHDKNRAGIDPILLFLSF